MAKYKYHTSVEIRVGTPTRSDVEKVLPKPWLLLPLRGPKEEKFKLRFKGVLVVVPADDATPFERLKAILRDALSNADMTAVLIPAEDIPKD